MVGLLLRERAECGLAATVLAFLAATLNSSRGGSIKFPRRKLAELCILTRLLVHVLCMLGGVGVAAAERLS